jgi:glutathione S-transferase
MPQNSPQPSAEADGSVNGSQSLAGDSFSNADCAVIAYILRLLNHARPWPKVQALL